MSARFSLSSRKEILSAINEATPSSKIRIATVNPEFMLESRRNQSFRRALAEMSHCIIDGSGLFFMLKLAGFKHVELYHGSDLVHDLLTGGQEVNRRFFLLGGPPGQAERAAQAITSRYPGIRVVGATDGGIIDAKSVALDPELERQLKDASPDILLVGFGAPKQELWIQAATDLPIPVMIGIGGTLGFYTDKKRAPRWMRTLHLEWLYRSLTEPGHWKRAYRAAVVFPLSALFWIGKRALSPGNDSR
jgi:N-acetylglucosaminyldiphosphoundecaprenol N-acetyl-beta-D-mannosaminyltransferase